MTPGLLLQLTLQAAHDEDRQHRAAHEREELIKQAKEAYRKQKESKKGDGREYHL